jgi:hypothetical protein
MRDCQRLGSEDASGPSIRTFSIDSQSCAKKFAVVMTTRMRPSMYQSCRGAERQ